MITELPTIGIEEITLAGMAMGEIGLSSSEASVKYGQWFDADGLTMTDADSNNILVK